MTAPVQTPFESFVAWMQRIRRERPDVLLLGETRIAEGLRHIRPVVALPSAFPTVHRCDLARAWCDRRGLEAWVERALVCEGVRHALVLLLGDLAGRGEKIGMPRDVYPVYGRIAQQVAVTSIEFDTFPDFDLARIFATCVAANVRHVLLPCPLKLHGRQWTADEFRTAAAWLGADPARRLLLDGVYSFGEPVSEGVSQLIVTGQVVYLDSMSKGWLHAQVFGTAVVPAADFDRLAPVFRSAPPVQEKLLAAQALLAVHAAVPELVARELARLRAVMRAALDARRVDATWPERGYFVPVRCSAATALAAHGIVTIPSEVFGVGAAPWSLASALG